MILQGYQAENWLRISFHFITGTVNGVLSVRSKHCSELYILLSLRDNCIEVK